MSALEEYKRAVRWNHDAAYTRSRADAAIAELQAEVERLKYAADTGKGWKQRAEAAEAMRDKAIDELRKSEERFAETEAEVGRLTWMLEDLIGQITELGECSSYFNQPWHEVPPGPADVKADLARRWEERHAT